MGALHNAGYGSLETRLDDARDETETRDGSVKHNGAMDIDLGRFPAGRGAEQAKVREPAEIMADTFVTQMNSESDAATANDRQLVDALMGRAFEEKPIWVGLWESIQDVFFPPKLPPLELTSTPIPVPDRMAVKANPWAIGISTFFNVAVLAFVLFFVGKKIFDAATKQATSLSSIDISLDAPKAPNKNGGGGGGGDHSIIQASKGRLPQIAKDPIVPPMVQTFDKPKIAAPAAIDVQKDIKLPDNPDLPTIGMKTGVNVVLSNGTGSGAGMGSGNGGGMGSGNGNGYGPGTGGNTGGGLEQVGGRVSAPVALVQPEAEFSDEARRAKYQGVCLVELIVDKQGNPQNVHVVRTLGMGLDEKAVEAVRRYKFRPAMRDGKTPVAVLVRVEVNFRLY
jgi:TonB family protein